MTQVRGTLSDDELRLGEADAYRELDLPQVFQPIPQYLDIADPHYLFLFGRRGAGKSAIARMLETLPAQRRSWGYRASIPGEWRTYGGYQQIVDEMARSSGPAHVQEVVKRLWAWVVRTKAMQVVVELAKESKGKLDSETTTMLTYLASLSRVRPQLHSQSPIGQLLQVVFSEASHAPDGIESYLTNLSSKPEYLSALAALARKTRSERLLLVFDSLDSYRIFEQPMIEGIRGVVAAMVEFAADPLSRGIDVKLFLPTEIMDYVVAQFPHKSLDSAVFLRWFGADSIAMLARRYLRVVDQHQVVSEAQLKTLRASVTMAEVNKDGRHLRQDFWYGTRFLPEKIRNRQGEWEDCLGYMFRHTFRRPRDLIAQLQSVAFRARDHGHFPYCTAEDVIEGVHDPRLLAKILGDAVTPYQAQLPEDKRGEGGLPIDLVSAARSAFSREPAVMTGRQARRFAKRLYNLYPVSAIEPDSFLQVLVSSGAIGWIPDEEAARRGRYNRARFSYVVSTNVPIQDDRLYCAHPVMANLFEMRPAEGFGVTYPLPDYDDWLEREARVTELDAREATVEVEDFGSLAAENDQNLSDYFITTPAFEALLSQQKYAAIGRKGTGKTALYLGLEAKRGWRVFVSGLTFGQYPWKLHDDALNAHAAESERYVNSWRFLILIEVAKLVLSDQGGNAPEARKALRSFVEANWGEIDFDHRKFYEPQRFMVTKSELRPQAMGISAASVTKEWVDRHRLGENLGSTLDWLERLLSEVLIPDNRYFILFDGLDTSFDLSNQAYSLRLIGLLLASKKTAAWSATSGKSVRAVVFLRDDIFNAIAFSDKNKIREDDAITVAWNDDDEGPESLKSLINARIRKSVGSATSEGNPWSVLFDTSELMRGRQQKYKHMAARTYLRPRDIIKFCNLALAEAQQRTRGSRREKQMITNIDIQNARPAYSEYLARELDDELVAHHDRWRELLDVIRRIGKEAFTRSDFDTELAKLSGWSQNSTEALEELFRFSVIAYVKRGRRGGGSDIVFRYRSAYAKLDSEATQFRVHPGLKEHLGLVEER